MSPKQTSQSLSTSPWTDCFQTSPIHTNGSYSNGASKPKDLPNPTAQALADIYDPHTRH